MVCLLSRVWGKKAYTLILETILKSLQLSATIPLSPLLTSAAHRLLVAGFHPAGGGRDYEGISMMEVSTRWQKEEVPICDLDFVFQV